MNDLIKWILTVVTIILVAVVLALGYAGVGIAHAVGGWKTLLNITIGIICLIVIWVKK